MINLHHHHHHYHRDKRYSLLFSTIQSPVLFNGFRNGDIKSSDIRLTGSRVPCMFMAQEKPVTSLKLLRDDVYLLVSGMDETVSRYLVRVLYSILASYEGRGTLA